MQDTGQNYKDVTEGCDHFKWIQDPIIAEIEYVDNAENSIFNKRKRPNNYNKRMDYYRNFDNNNNNNNNNNSQGPPKKRVNCSLNVTRVPPMEITPLTMIDENHPYKFLVQQNSTIEQTLMTNNHDLESLTKIMIKMCQVNANIIEEMRVSREKLNPKPKIKRKEKKEKEVEKKKNSIGMTKKKLKLNRKNNRKIFNLFISNISDISNL